MAKNKGAASDMIHDHDVYPSRQAMLQAYQSVRQQTIQLCKSLKTEDYVVQTMKCVSPAKWHLAHTTWFFEQFILIPFAPGYKPHNEQYLYLFNSYYNTVGPQHCQAERGYLSRPTVEDVYAYRQIIDKYMMDLMNACCDDDLPQVRNLLTVGINHEQQHQELILTDIKHVLSSNPLLPAYIDVQDLEPSTEQTMSWRSFEEGVVEIGFDSRTQNNPTLLLTNNAEIKNRQLLSLQFCFDNEKPRHKTFCQAFQIASRLVTNQEYIAFIEDGGYTKPEYWLSLGWQWCNENEATHPIYWYLSDKQWMQYTLHGPKMIDPNEPVCHINYFEADAFARWAGYRLPREDEWELAASQCAIQGNMMESQIYHPQAIADINDDRTLGLQQMFGDVWEWTSSAYVAYPGYQPPDGALGEYNGKFMCNQQVLRGGSCATPTDHIRASYRNFWAPETRWQFTGIRLARDI